jgi:hypothetical protein
MPNRKVHKELSLKLLGYYTPSIHILIDDASKRFGSKHRIFNHSQKILDLIELVYGEKERKEALLHILADAKIVDAEKWLEYLHKKKNKLK